MPREELRDLSASLDTLMDLGRDEEAESLLAEALRVSQSDPAYHLFFQAEAAGYLEADHRKREYLLRQGLEEAPDDAFLLRNLGGAYLLEKKLGKAGRYLDKALQADPDDPDTLRCLGLLCTMKGKETKAIEWYRKALAENPDDHDAMRQIGVSLSKLGKDQEALDWYRKAYECCRDDYDAMRQMGISFAMLKDLDAATHWLELALEVHPGDLESKRNLRLVRQKQRGEGNLFFSALITRMARRLTFLWRRLMDRFG